MIPKYFKGLEVLVTTTFNGVKYDAAPCWSSRPQKGTTDVQNRSIKSLQGLALLELSKFQPGSPGGKDADPQARSCVLLTSRPATNRPDPVALIALCPPVPWGGGGGVGMRWDYSVSHIRKPLSHDFPNENIQFIKVFQYFYQYLTTCNPCNLVQSFSRLSWDRYNTVSYPQSPMKRGIRGSSQPRTLVQCAAPLHTCIQSSGRPRGKTLVTPPCHESLSSVLSSVLCPLCSPGQQPVLCLPDLEEVRQRRLLVGGGGRRVAGGQSGGVQEIGQLQGQAELQVGWNG